MMFKIPSVNYFLQVLEEMICVEAQRQTVAKRADELEKFGVFGRSDAKKKKNSTESDT